MFEIIELQRKLMEARGEDPTSSNYRMRTARVQQQQQRGQRQQQQERDIKNLVKEGYNHAEIAQILSLPLETVDKLDRYNEMRRKYLTTGELELPRSAAVFTIFIRKLKLLTKDNDKFVDLIGLLRNSIHNNGVYESRGSLKIRKIKWNNTVFLFVENKLISQPQLWSNLISFSKEICTIFTDIINSHEIKKIRHYHDPAE